MGAEILAAAAEHLAAGEFEAALDVLTGWPGAPTAELLEKRGQAAYGAGDLEAALRAYEDQHELHLRTGNTEGAAQSAVMVGMYLMMDTGLMAPVRSWLSRAGRLLDDRPESPVHAWLAVVKTYERFMCGDMPGAGTWAQRAIDGGDEHGLAAPGIVGRVALGRVRIHDGEIDQGLELLDDVALTLSAGDLDPLTTGQMWCELICAMQWVAQYDRAEQWTELMERWRRGSAFGGLHGRCRVHRAEIFRQRGDCSEAEEEAIRACEELRPWMRREFGWPLTELGNVRLRKGDFEGAEEAFLAAHQNAWCPEPGLALLRLAQGRTEEAASLIENALEHPFDIPSKEFPPSGDLRRAPLLDARVRVAIASGQLDTAKAAADELARTATRYQSRGLKAAATVACGRVALASSDTKSALAHLSAGVTEWISLRMPYEAAVTRLDLAAALFAAGDRPAAELELAAAERSFDDLGARRWATLARELRGASSGEATAPSRECVFRCDGDTRTMTFDDATVLLRDLKGMRYLERLLVEPGREFHVLDLLTTERGASPACAEATSTPPGGERGLEIFDAVARDSYRRRLAEVEADIEEAEANNDLHRAALARADREYLVDELARGVGLSGRSRVVGSESERARMSTTRAVRYALKRIAEHHPSLADHLRRTIRTGTYFAYEPDPRLPTTWSV